MAEVLLAPPRSWADRLRTLPVEQLVLSYDPQALKIPAGRSLSDITNDLVAGVWLARARSARDEIFRLGGTEFELRVKRRPGRETGAWMAEVLNVDESKSVPRTGKILAGRVAFEKVWEEASCDLADLEDKLRQREQRLRQDRRRGAPLQAEVRAHGSLQAAVRHQYGELETLVSVLEQRPQRPEEAVNGVVRSGRGRPRGGRQAIVVAPRSGEAWEPYLFRGKRVQLARPDGSTYNTQVTAVRGDRLEIAEPRDWAVAPGEQVNVSIVRPFAMWQNAEALARFRAGNLEGSWDDLARLLCRPGNLLLPTRPAPPAVFYCDDDPDVPSLNDEQRRAVIGAVGSPHAFLIQGPPGTGKTEVICEIVRQLVGWGERVLLLAPTHVAVDEVLGRIGHKPGVRALRITWSDDLVDEELRAFLPKNVGIESTSRILRPTDDGQTARWERELGAVGQRLAAIAELREITRRRLSATEALRPVTAMAADTAERLRVREASAETESVTLRRALADDELTLVHALAAAQAAARFEEAERAEVESGLTALRGAADTLLTAISAAAEAEAAAVAATDALRVWSAAYLTELDRIGHARSRAEQGAIEARNHLQAAEQAVSSAQATLADAVQRQTGWGRFAERLGLGAVAQARDALAHAEDVERQWRAEVAVRQESRYAATTAQNALLARAPAEKAELEQRVTHAESSRERHAQGRFAAFQEFVDALSAVEARFDETGVTTWEECHRLGLVVRAVVDAVLDLRAGASVAAFASAPPFAGMPGLAPVADRMERLWHAAAARERHENELAAARRRRDGQAARLRQAEAAAIAEVEHLTDERDAAQEQLAIRRDELDVLTRRRDALVAELGEANPAGAETVLLRRRHVLQNLPALHRRWWELTGERTNQELVEDVRNSLVRATNLVCATTKGIVGGGSHLLRHTDYDTLIVDEASRVTESEFLIGAVKARRWVLVGDEHQLPPYVDQDDEHFLHALTALHRTGRGAAPTIEQAVDDLATLWAEDEKERAYRRDAVLGIVEDLDSTGQWRLTFRDQFAEAHRKFTQGKDGHPDADRNLLQAMRRYLVQSLFQRAVVACHPELRQRLEWQRRMIAPLAQIVNEPIYGGQYRSPPDAELAAAGVTPLVLPRVFERPAIFLDTSHYADAGDTMIKHGFVNTREQDLVVRACQIYNAELRAPITASVLAFYRAQARELERRLLALPLPMLRWEVIDVIDRIQGQQSDLVVLSFTRARRGGFGDNYGQWLQDVRRLNVACTRARRALVLVGHGKTLRWLRASKQARAFYSNLLGLFEADENFQRILDLE